jgi:hypothetical protein
MAFCQTIPIKRFMMPNTGIFTEETFHSSVTARAWFGSGCAHNLEGRCFCAHSNHSTVVFQMLHAVMDEIIIAYDLLGIHSYHDYTQSYTERCKQMVS